jgi:hypothetical protein
VSPILGIWASQNYVRTLPGSYESIATTTVGAGGSSSISFTSIPSTYKHLQIRAIQFCGTTAYNTLIRYNSDSGNNYASHYLEGNGSTVGSGTGYGAPPINYGAIGEARGGTTYPDVFVCDILDYTNTNKYKTARSLCGYDANGSGLAAFRSSLWMSTSAVTSITIQNDAFANFTQYSQFALYGIKG